MCGIAGILNLKDKRIDRTILEKMVGIQKHRGPDSEGFYYGENIGLGHKRLAIIDLSERAHQPMSNEDKSMWIIHNGEIYNYLELREELIGLGHIFKSSSDAEVILHAFEEWREEALRRFNGMWAFAIWDCRKKMLFTARDRFGVKPFYYYIDDEIFIFGSEIKSLLKHPKIKAQPNDRAIFDYLISGYGYMDISDYTFFKDIKQLRPSHYVKLSIEDKKFSQVRYWDLDPHRVSRIKSEEDVYRNFYNLFEDSIRLRLRSDVPFGVSLSGGLDSSSIACVAAGLLKNNSFKTFSSCFDEEEYDERKFIKPVLDKTKANASFIFTKPEKLFDEIEDIIWHQEEPYSALSIFPQWYVMKLAREKGIKVLLTGQGGDETLAGYHKYYFYLFADLVRSLKWGKALKEIRLYSNAKSNKDSIFNPILKIILSYMAPRILKESFKSSINKRFPVYLNRDFVMNNSNRIFTERKFDSILNNDLYNALKISPLPSLLHIDDRSSMAHSVESRAPFLDYRLVEFVFSLGPEYKIRNGITKYVLRESLKDILPEEVRMRRDKMGFAAPLKQWFRTNLKDRVYDILTSKEFLGRPYFDQKNVLQKFKSFVEDEKDNSQYTIWSWVNLELWFRKFIDAK